MVRPRRKAAGFLRRPYTITHGMTRTSILCLCLLGFSINVQADIYTWEYVDPSDPSQGKRQSMTLAPDGAGVMPGLALDASMLDLSMAYLIGSDLTEANFYQALVLDADFTAAVIRGASFSAISDSSFTAQQLYSTASYQDGDLRGVVLAENDLSGWDLSQKNLEGSGFAGATMTGIALSGANLSGSHIWGGIIDFR